MRERFDFILRFLLFFWLVTFLLTLFLLGLRWLTVIEYQVISEDLRLWEFYLPVLLSFCSVAFFIRPRFKDRFDAIYNCQLDKMIGNGFIIYLSLMIFVSSKLMSDSQKYLVATYGDLITIKSLDEVLEHPKGRFFKIDSIAYNPYYGAFLEKNRRSLPSKNPKLNMNHYIVNPIHDSRIQYYKPPLRYWMGLHTERAVAISRLGKDNSVVKDQWNAVYDQIDSYDIGQVKFYYRTPSSGLLDSYKEAIESRYGEKVARKAVLLEPKTFPFEDRAKNRKTPLLLIILSSLAIVLFLLGHKRETAVNESKK